MNELDLDSPCKEPTCNARDTGDADLVPGSGRPPEEEMAINSSILAWKIPWTEEPVGYSPESQRARHD